MSKIRQTNLAPNKEKMAGWINFRYLELNGRIKKTLRHPRRERVIVRTALRRMGVLFRESVPFYNPLYNGYRNSTNGSIMWLDFVIYTKKTGILVFQFNLNRGQSGVKSHERELEFNKAKFLKLKSIPYTVMKRTLTSHEYEIIMRMSIIRHSRKD